MDSFNKIYIIYGDYRLITITDYIGHSDKYGKPTGHPIKVINEMAELVYPIAEVGVAIPKSHMPGIRNQSLFKLFEMPNHIDIFSTDKFGNLKKKWENLSVLMKAKTDIVWFINVDFSLFLFLYLFGMNSHKVWITLCYNPLKKVKGWRERIILSVLNKIDLVIITNRNFEKTIPGNSLFIPDYYYKSDLYDKYLNVKKKKQFVVLGTMGKSKQLEGLIEVIKKLEFPLIVRGNFSQDEERFEKLKKQSFGYNSIQIDNKYVENEEYYQLMAESSYVVLPYDMNLYDERTSGILIESMFLGCIPIAPEKLLQFNSINGIGYNQISELLNEFDRVIDYEIIEKNQRLVETVFSLDKIREKMQNILNR